MASVKRNTWWQWLDLVSRIPIRTCCISVQRPSSSPPRGRAAVAFAAMSSSGWAFNLRTSRNLHADDSSDSDSDSCEHQTSEDTRLLNEIDISSREETVAYKPNPFSIAKINAAVRKPNPVPKPAPTKLKSPPRKPSSTATIPNAFKKQTQRPAATATKPLTLPARNLKQATPNALSSQSTRNAPMPPSKRMNIQPKSTSAPALTHSQPKLPGYFSSPARHAPKHSSPARKLPAQMLSSPLNPNALSRKPATSNAHNFFPQAQLSNLSTQRRIYAPQSQTNGLSHLCPQHFLQLILCSAP